MFLKCTIIFMTFSENAIEQYPRIFQCLGHCLYSVRIFFCFPVVTFPAGFVGLNSQFQSILDKKNWVKQTESEERKRKYSSPIVLALASDRRLAVLSALIIHLKTGHILFQYQKHKCLLCQMKLFRFFFACTKTKQF